LKKPPTDAAIIFPLKKAGRQAVSQKKIGEDLASPSDLCPGLLALLQSDMLKLYIIYQRIARCQAHYFYFSLIPKAIKKT
jgi:hypothetical protein